MRGVGHNFVGRNNLRSKQRIRAGWHQNRCDPNLSTTHVKYNRHEPLPQLAPADFGAFLGQGTKLWAIGLQTPEVLLRLQSVDETVGVNPDSAIERPRI